MGIVIDIIIILFILASAFFGYKKGLISLAINILAFIIAMVVTLLLYKPIGNIIINNTTFLAFNYSNEIFIENLSNKIKLSELEDYLKTI